MHLKLRQFEVFKAVMETGPISAAAIRLPLTRPAVSIALSNWPRVRAFGRVWDFAGRSAGICAINGSGP